MKKNHLFIVLPLVLSSFNLVIAQTNPILIPYQDGGTRLWGYVDENKNTKIPFKYTLAEKFSDGLAKVYFENDSTLRNGTSYFAFIDINGNIAFKFDKKNYHAAHDFHNGFAIVEGEYPNLGGINKKGEILIPIIYSYIGEFDKNGLTQIKIKNKTGLIDTTGKIVIPPKYDEIGSFKDGVATFKETKEIYSNETGGFIKQTNSGLMDISGKEIVGAKYDNIGDFHFGFAKIYTKGKYGFVNKTLKEIISVQFDDAQDFKIFDDLDGKVRNPKSNDLVKKYIIGVPFTLVKINYKDEFNAYRNEWGGFKSVYLDTTGNKNLFMNLDFIDVFSEGLARFVWDEEYNLGEREIDSRGIMDGANTNDPTQTNDNNFLKIKFGFVNEKGEEIIQRKYDRAENFHNGLSRVCVYEKGKYSENEPKFGFINKQGNTVVQIKYDDTGNLSEGLIWLKLNGQFGYVDNHGNQIIPFKTYDAVGEFHNGLAWVAISKTETFNQDKCYGCQYDKYGKIIKGEKTTEQKTETKKLYGYIDKQGAEVISPKYGKANDFVNGTAKVKLSDGSTITINKQGLETH